MSEPIAPAAPAAPSSSDEFQTAAITAMKAMPAEPELKLDESKLIIEPPKPEAPADSVAESLRKMAAGKAAARLEKERTNALSGLEQQLGPQGIHALARAQAAGDVKGILAALGVKPGDVQYEAVKDEVAEAQKPKTPEDPRYDELKREFESLKDERRQERTTRGRATTLETVKEMAKDPKYQYVGELGAFDEALSAVEEYIQLHGEMPAETREESLRLGLDLVEERYKKEAEKWERVLTKRKSNATIQSEAPGTQPQAVSEVAHKTLSHTTAPAPVRAPSEMQSSEDYITEALKAIRQFPQT